MKPKKKRRMNDIFIFIILIYMLYEVHFLWNKTHRCVRFCLRELWHDFHGSYFSFSILLVVVWWMGWVVWIQFGSVYGRYFSIAKHVTWHREESMWYGKGLGGNDRPSDDDTLKRKLKNKNENIIFGRYMYMNVFICGHDLYLLLARLLQFLWVLETLIKV